MKRLLLSISVLLSLAVFAQNDTIFVPAQNNAQLTWYGNYDAVAACPTEGEFEKINMNFVLGCSDGGCSHWDYTVSVFLMEPTGMMDSSIVSIDTLATDSTQIDTLWNVYEVMEKFELGRLITPYGNYMDWESSSPNDIFEDSWTHSYDFDVSDYASLLTDSSLIRVHFGGWPQEGRGFSSTINFEFIEGTPARDVISIENMYPVGGYSYKSLVDNDHFPPITKVFTDDMKSVVIKSCVSGHGHEGPDNCCEWESKQHAIKIDGQQYQNWYVWKDCGMATIYPQGGTWPFDRAGWCPGSAVDIEESDITGLFENNTEVELDYTVANYTSDGEENGSFIVSNTLITYGDYNFAVDMEVMDIIKPTNKDRWSRQNPICDNPKIILRNRGSEYVNSVQVHYGIEGQEMSVFEAGGGFVSLTPTEIELPIPNWTGANDSSKFVVTVIAENDEYDANNTMKVDFDMPDLLPSEFILEYRTQSNFQGMNRASESSYKIYDQDGEIVHQNNGPFESSTFYRDTITLDWGCYNFVFEDSEENGINRQWYYGEGQSTYAQGLLRLRGVGSGIIKTFPDDFGQQIDYAFTTVYGLETSFIEDTHFEVYPNPTVNQLNVSLSLSQKNDVSITVFNNLGEQMFNTSKVKFTSGEFSIDTSSYSTGVYYCKLNTGDSETVKKFVISK